MDLIIYYFPSLRSDPQARWLSCVSWSTRVGSCWPKICPTWTQYWGPWTSRSTLWGSWLCCKWLSSPKSAQNSISSGLSFTFGLFASHKKWLEMRLVMCSLTQHKGGNHVRGGKWMHSFDCVLVVCILARFHGLSTFCEVITFFVFLYYGVCEHQSTAHL